MSTTKYTPAPWTFESTGRFDNRGSRRVCGGATNHGYGGHAIADVLETKSTARPDEMRDANAHLITAAPNLLAFAQLFLEWKENYVAEYDCEDGVRLQLKSLENMAAVAIAKAEGRES